MLPCSSNATTQDIASSLIVQVKSEGTLSGRGHFLKEGDEIPASKSVLRVVYGPLQVS